MKKIDYMNDGWTCQICEISYYHITPYKVILDNLSGKLTTVCNKCHKIKEELETMRYYKELKEESVYA